MDQRKLMDNANTITDMAKVSFLNIMNVNEFLSKHLPILQTQNNVYELVSDMSGRQDALEDRLGILEDKLQAIQVPIFSYIYVMNDA